MENYNGTNNSENQNDNGGNVVNETYDGVSNGGAQQNNTYGQQGGYNNSSQQVGYNNYGQQNNVYGQQGGYNNYGQQNNAYGHHGGYNNYGRQGGYNNYGQQGGYNNYGYQGGYNNNIQKQDSLPGKGLGIAGFILSIVTLLSCCWGIYLGWVGIITGILALVFTSISRSKAKKAGRKNGLATAGFTIIMIYLIFWVLLILGFVLITLLGGTALFAEMELSGMYFEDFANMRINI